MKLTEILPLQPWTNGGKCETHEEIRQWCNSYIQNTVFSIDSDGKVNCRGEVKLDGIGKNSRHVWTNLPVKFGEAQSMFEIKNRGLTTLEGVPDVVGDKFDCSGNNLTSLEHAPRAVGSFVFCDNKISSLKTSKKINVFTDFVGGDCPIVDIRGIANDLEFDADGYGTIALDWEKIRHGGLGLLDIENLVEINTVVSYNSQNGAMIARGDNFLTDPFKIISKHLKEKDVFACQQELILAGFEEFAQL